MPIIALPVVAQDVASGRPGTSPPCEARQLSFSTDGPHVGATSHTVVEASVRNTGMDCTLTAMPSIRFLDARGRVLRAKPRVSGGHPPAPAMPPVRLGGGHRAAIELSWNSEPMHARGTRVSAASIRITFGSATLLSPIEAVPFSWKGAPARFSQTPLRVMEGVAAD